MMTLVDEGDTANYLGTKMVDFNNVVYHLKKIFSFLQHRFTLRHNSGTTSSNFKVIKKTMQEALVKIQTMLELTSVQS